MTKTLEALPPTLRKGFQPLTRFPQNCVLRGINYIWNTAAWICGGNKVWGQDLFKGLAGDWGQSPQGLDTEPRGLPKTEISALLSKYLKIQPETVHEYGNK